MSVYRFDLAGLTPNEVEDLKTRLGIVEFMMKDDPIGRFTDLYTEREIDPAELLKGFKKINYIDYSHIPWELWSYPFI